MSARSEGVSYYDFYSALKTYLMMTSRTSEPRRKSASSTTTSRFRGKTLSSTDTEGVVLSLTQLRYYAGRMAKRDPDLVIERDEAAVQRARLALQRYSLLERNLYEPQTEGNLKLRPLTLEAATEERRLPEFDQERRRHLHGGRLERIFPGCH